MQARKNGRVDEHSGLVALSETSTQTEAIIRPVGMHFRYALGAQGALSAYVSSEFDFAWQQRNFRRGNSPLRPSFEGAISDVRYLSKMLISRYRRYATMMKHSGPEDPQRTSMRSEGFIRKAFVVRSEFENAALLCSNVNV
jgi:hypothetical protein